MSNWSQLLYNTMNTYPHSLYKEILKDYQFRFPKYSPIDYPTMRNPSKPVLKQRPIWNPKYENN